MQVREIYTMLRTEGIKSTSKSAIDLLRRELYTKRSYSRRIRQAVQSVRYDAPPKIDTILFVDPAEIEYTHIYHPKFDWNVENEYSQHWLLGHDYQRSGFYNKDNLGRIIGGDWDKAKIKFEETNVYRAMDSVFNKGQTWEETDLFKIYERRLKSGYDCWGCSTMDDLVEKRGSYLEWLYYNMQETGYDSQIEHSAKGDFSLWINNDDFYHNISINIGRDGELIFNKTGHHRLAVAKLVGIDEIPVIVIVRHSNWQALRDRLYRYPDAGTPIYGHRHPDLADIVRGCE